MNKFFAAAMAATALFASCAKENSGNGETNGEKQAVKISISREATTRAIGEITANDPEVVFNDGYVLFSNTAGVISKVVEVENTAAVYDGTSSVGVDALDTEKGGGAWITDVPKTANTVHFVGNMANASIVPAVGQSIASIIATVDKQYKADGSVDNVMLYGSAAMIPATVGQGGAAATADEYETATFQVSPIAARFELGEIVNAANDDDPNSNGDVYYVKSFDLVGIFVDNYYQSMTINGTTNAVAVYNGRVPAEYIADYATPAGVVFDFNATGLTIPTTGVEAWTYNLLAPKALGTGSTEAAVAMPAIVIKLDNVVVTNGTVDTPLNEQYLTIKNFYNKESSNALITNLVQGKIYWIETISFTAEDLTDEPYMTLMDCRVEIELMDWETIATGYDFN